MAVQKKLGGIVDTRIYGVNFDVRTFVDNKIFIQRIQSSFDFRTNTHR